MLSRRLSSSCPGSHGSRAALFQRYTYCSHSVVHNFYCCSVVTVIVLTIRTVFSGQRLHTLFPPRAARRARGWAFYLRQKKVAHATTTRTTDGDTDHRIELRIPKTIRIRLKIPASRPEHLKTPSSAAPQPRPYEHTGMTAFDEFCAAGHDPFVILPLSFVRSRLHVVNFR